MPEILIFQLGWKSTIPEIWTLNHFLKDALDRWRKTHQLKQLNRQTNPPNKIGSFTLTMSTKLQWFLFLGCKRPSKVLGKTSKLCRFVWYFCLAVELCQITTFPLRAPLNAPKKEKRRTAAKWCQNGGGFLKIEKMWSSAFGKNPTPGCDIDWYCWYCWWIPSL